MEAWNDAPQILLSFTTALRSFDWQRVHLLTSSLVGQLDQLPSPFPEPIAKNILSNLRRRRQFRNMEQLADAFIRSGVNSAEIYRQYAQSMIDQGSFTGASLVLNAILNDTSAPRSEHAEASGLLGRVSKQLYINANNAGAPRQRANLSRAIQKYFDVYRTDPSKFYWHGMNVVALLHRAVLDGVPVEIVAEKDRILVELSTLLDKDELSRWERATAIELALATGDSRAMLNHAMLFASDLDVDAFEIGSLLRQLQDVWRLDAESEPGETLLPLLQAALLQRAGGKIELDISSLPRATEKAKRAGDGLERVFGQERYHPLDWLRMALTRCSAVGRVETKTGKKIGSGFLVKADDFFPSRPKDELLFLTNSHVISPADNLYGEAIPPAAAQILFEDSGQKVGVGELVWSSPPGSLDASFITLTGFGQLPEVCPLTPSPTPFDRDKTQRLYVIGYPLGGGLSVSLQDSIWLDRDNKVLHYRTPTEPGSSGSPVFDQDYWTVVGLHHKGKKDLPKLNGSPGTYDANEAISISTIQQETRAAGQ